MKKGQVVFSKAGRDKQKAFIVVSVNTDYAYLSDGRTRKLAKPKKKKHRHIQITHTIIDEINYKLENGLYLNDADLRKALDNAQGLS